MASRIADWKIKLADTIADNASYGGFTVGPWDRKLRDSDLSAVNMTIRQNGVPAGQSLGSAVLGNPGVAWPPLKNVSSEILVGQGIVGGGAVGDVVVHM